ncbi:MAG: alpha/beta fold hydrolase [Chloroflexi bacterium]|nr:alpha/beta fold hydrolase [Chloroflexota bacterium]
MPTQYQKHQNGKIAYDDTGSGPLVLCIPSMGDLRGEYRFLAPQLAAAGYRVVTLDVRGHGETSTRWPDFSVGAIGSDMLALIRSLHAGPAVLIGTSMAAGAAVWAAEAPELVTGLVLIGPFVRGEGSWPLQLLFTVLFARPWGPAMWRRHYTTLWVGNSLQATVQMVPGAGHYPHAEMPEVTGPRILAFLQTLTVQGKVAHVA